MGSEAVSGRFGGVSGNLRAVGSTRTDDRRSPKGTGGAKGRRGRERRPSSRSDGSSVVLVAREAGDRDADELARDGPVPAVRGGAQERFGGVRRAGLSHSKVDKPAYPLGPRFAGPRQGLAGGCAPSDPPTATAHHGRWTRAAPPLPPRRRGGHGTAGGGSGSHLKGTSLRRPSRGACGSWRDGSSGSLL